jgi:Na+/H+ antiporter NhaD/arsenite permease-like protein
MPVSFWIAVGIFGAAYVLICLESFHRTHKTVIALAGAGLVLVTRILSQEEAFGSLEFGVDWNVIFLLIGMMIIINIIKPTGLFEYLAVKCVQWGRGEPYRIMAVFAVVTALVSSMIDNVTTILLIAPVMIYVTHKLELNPVPFLVSAVFASNIGGTATLIGDPPNIMIASKSGLTFMDFINHLAPAVGIMMVVYLVMIRILFHREFKVSEASRARAMQLNAGEMIKDARMVGMSMTVLVIMVACFVFHSQLGLLPATIAFGGAALLLFLSRHKEKPIAILSEIEWTSIFFFIGLFIIIGAVVKVGFITMLAKAVIGATGGDIFKTSMVLLWFSGVASAIIDNIPFVATVNPLIIDMARQLWPNVARPEIVHQAQLLPVWWGLALGACLGGNGTIIGASANVVAAGIAEKHGYKISFFQFMRYAFPVWLMTLIISHLYIWLRYF